MLPKRRKLNLECLESREMKAGDVAVSLQGGNLFITEAAGQAGWDNAIQISQQSNGMIRVAGTATADGTSTHVNGQSYQDFKVTGSLNVNLGGGNDLVVIGSEAGVGNPTFTAVNIDVSAPAIVAAPAVAGKTAVTGLTPSDNDDVIIWGMNSKGAVNINTGAGNDWVYLANSSIGDGIGADDLNINTGAGADTVNLENLSDILYGGKINVQTYSNINETDADTVWFDSVYTKGDIQVLTGGGADLLHMSNSSTIGNMNFDMGAGNDTVNFDHVDINDKLMAHLGDGDDTMTIDYLYGTEFHFFGDAGSDHLNRTANVFGNTAEQTGWEFLNGRMVPPVGTIGGGLSKSL